MKSLPLISVVVPNYNHGRYLDELIYSLQLQTYKNFEIIFVDDCSSDNSKQVLLKHSSLDPRISVIFLKENMGVENAVKVGCDLAKGELLFATGADDFFVWPDYFSCALVAFNDYPDISGYFGKTRMVDSASMKTIGTMGHCIREGFISPKEVVDGFLMGKIFIPGSSSIWKKKYIDQIGGYPKNMGPMLDYYLNHLLPSLHGVYFENQIVANYRVFKNRNNFSANISSKEKIKSFNRIEYDYRKLSPHFEENKNWNFWKTSQIASYIVFDYLKFPNNVYRILKKYTPIRLIEWLKKMIYMSFRKLETFL